jgi:lambda family phage tail tape measure protein
MSDEATTVGTARLALEVDVSRYDATINLAKSRFSDLSADVQKQLSSMNVAQKRATDAIVTYNDTVGKSRGEMLLYKAAMAGVSGPALDEFKLKVAQSEAALRGATTQLNAYGLSAKQSAAALRQVPAQVTDIVTGLASGQRPLMVLLQQGGQLKDVFGGIAPAARALGGSLLGLINPYTLAAAGAALAAYEFHKAQQEAFEFEKAIVLSGNAANVTSSQLAAMAGQIAAAVGTRGNASEVLQQLVATGKVSATVLESAAQAVINLNRVGGVPLEQTIANLVALGEKPTEASRKLNREYGYFNAGTLERIKLLEEEGRAAEAAALAQNRFTGESLARVDQLKEQLTGLSWLWQEVSHRSVVFWNRLVDDLPLVGGPESIDEKIARYESTIASLKRGLANSGQWDEINGANSARRARLAEYEAEVASLKEVTGELMRRAGAQAVVRAQERDTATAIQQWDKLAESNLSKREKLEKEIAQIRRLGLAAHKSEAEIEQQIAAARAKVADPPKKPKENSDDNSAKTFLESIERQVAANMLLVDSGEKVSASETLMIRARQMLADKTNTMTDATRVLLQAMLPTLAASDASARAAQNEAKAKEALSRQNAILDRQLQNQRDSNDIDLLSIGLGQDELLRMQRRIAIERDYEAQLRGLGERKDADDKQLWDRQIERARQVRSQMLAQEESFQKQRVLLMADPMVGARAALQDYLASARDVAGQTRETFSNMFASAEDAAVRFATTGKFSFKNFANEVISDLLRIQIRAQLAAIYKNVLGQALGAGGSTWDVSPTPPASSAPPSRVGVWSDGAPSAIDSGMLSAGSARIMATAGATTSTGAPVNVHIHGAPSVPQTRTRRNADGGIDVDILFRQVEERVADSVLSGGRVASAMRNRFDISDR